MLNTAKRYLGKLLAPFGSLPEKLGLPPREGRDAWTMLARLLYAIRHDDRALFDDVLAAGFDVRTAMDFPDLTEEHWQRQDVIPFIPHFHADNLSPLHHAIAHHRAEMLETLVAHGALDSFQKGVTLTPLCHAAVRAGCPAEMFERLVDAGIGLEEKNDQGCTPLLKAASYACAEPVRILLALGADPHAVDGENRNALQLLPIVMPSRMNIRPYIIATFEQLLNHGVDYMVPAENLPDDIVDTLKIGQGHIEILYERCTIAEMARTYLQSDFFETPPLERAGKYVTEAGTPVPELWRMIAVGGLPNLLKVEHWEEAPEEALKIWNAAGPYYQRKHAEIDLVFARNEAPIARWQEVAERPRTPLDSGQRR